METAKRDLRVSGDLVMAPRVPHGLAAAVEGLTREVIRRRPEDIYVFAAQHFEELLKLRDEYGAVSNLPGRSTNTAALREMNQSLKKRNGEREIAKSKERGGWSMNETARVLERHRSVFGDKGRKVSPEEVRALGNEKENESRSKDDFAKFAAMQKRRGSNERFVKRRTLPKDAGSTETKSRSDSSGNPKFISQIPTLTGTGGLLAKDIKSELRKNRNSSRDGRSIRERAEKKTSERTERFEIASKNTGASKKSLIRRSSRDRSVEKFHDRDTDEDLYNQQSATDNQKHKTDANGGSRSLAKIPRTLSMDRVREFVVEKFRSSESWDDLASMNYVGRVQEVIDDAAPTIRRRVQELSTRSAGRSRGYESVDESTSTSTRSDKSNQTDDVRSRSAMPASRRSRRRSAHRRSKSKSKSKSKTSGADSLEGIETLASEVEHSKESARNDVETAKLPESQSGNVEERAGHAKSANTNKNGAKSSTNGLSGESDVSENADAVRKVSLSSSISLPAVRPPSSKNHSRSVSRSDSDNLVLPPISPEVSKSAKQREDLVLPSLQFPPRTPESEESKELLEALKTPEEKAASLGDKAKVELNLPDASTEEIFNDSLNVTPEINASPRPDSLEPHGGRAKNDEVEDNIAELKSELDEIDSGGEKKTGMTERLREIEETEKRIEKILLAENRSDQIDNADVASVKEKLVEIQEAEKRLRDALNSGAEQEESHRLEAEEFQQDKVHTGIQDELIKIEGIEKNIEKIFHSEDEVTQDVQIDVDIKEKLMEIQEAEKRIEKILYFEAEEIQDDKPDTKSEERSMSIEETDAKIAEILLADTQSIEKDRNETNMKEKLSAIEEAAKSIDKILPSKTLDVMKNQIEADFTKKELVEEQEIPERLKNNSVTPCAEENRDQIIIVERNDQIEDLQMDLGDKSVVIPKTPFIPEIPSEYVLVADDINVAEVSHDKEKIAYVSIVDQIPGASSNTEITNEERESHNELQAREQLISGTPDSLGNSYILTEGSPYDIPDTVTTVIIPERQVDTPSSDVLEIVLVDDLEDDSKLSEVTVSGANDDPTDTREISLRNILDNFGEIVQEETAGGSPVADIDFMRGLKSGNDGIIARKDLGLIREENDNELADINDLKTPVSVDLFKSAVTPTLDDIAESEEILETQDVTALAQNLAEIESAVPEERNRESTDKKSEAELKKITANQVTEGLGAIEKSDKSQSEKDTEILIIEDENPESLDEAAEATSPTTAVIESLQQNVTDSATTESTDEVKETTISDDGENSAPESSVTSPSCAENIGTRNSESSNEVKETTISDQPADDVGKNLFSLIPQCHGSMPHVPELNLDSLQDVTVSSFQLSDDVTAEEDSDAGQPTRENGSSLTTEAEELNESQSQEPIHEEIIIKERVAVKEDLCTKVSAYVTEPDSEEIDISDSKIAEIDIAAVESRETAGKFHEEVTETVHEKIAEKIPGKVAAIADHETAEKLEENMSLEAPEKVPEEVAAIVDREVAEKSTERLNEVSEEKENEEVEKVQERITETTMEEIAEKVHEEVLEKLPEEVGAKIQNYATKELVEEVVEKIHDVVSEKISGEATKEIAEEISEKILEEKIEKTPVEDAEKLVEKVHEAITAEVCETVSDVIAKTLPTEVTEKVIDELTDDLALRPISGQMDSVSLRDFKMLEATIEDEYLRETVAENVGSFDDPRSKSSEGLTIVLDDGGSIEQIDEPIRIPAEGTSLISGEPDSPEVLTDPHPPKADVTTSDLIGNGNCAERMEYHIYVPDVTTSEDTTTESSTFNSAATKIQAGVRGFLTRRRLQSAQRRSSTLDSVPSIQESFATDAPHLEPIEEVGLAQAATTIQSNYRGYKARQRLRREDAVQKTTLSVENAFSGGGLQHTGEFHDCLPLPPPQLDAEDLKSASKLVNTQPKRSEDDPSDAVIPPIDEQGKSNTNTNTNENPQNRKCVTDTGLDCMDSPTGKDVDKEESVDEDSTVALFMKKYPYAYEGLNLVVVSSNDAILQSQYLNFITSIEEVRNETDLLIGPNHSKVVESLSNPKSNVGIESLPMDDTCISDVSVATASSVREPLAIPGTPTGIVIEELSKTDEGSIPDFPSTTSTDKDARSRTNLAEDLSEIPGDSLDLPGLSLERQAEDRGQTILTDTANLRSDDDQLLHSLSHGAKDPESKSVTKDDSEIGRAEEMADNSVVSLVPDVPPDGSLGTMSFSMNVDDMLGLGAESELPSNMKPIFEVTVMPRDLLKLTNRSEGSQASGERAESPVTMMQIVPKSVEEKSERSEEKKVDEVKSPNEEVLEEQVIESETQNNKKKKLSIDRDGSCDSIEENHEKNKVDLVSVELSARADENETTKSVFTQESFCKKDDQSSQETSEMIIIDQKDPDSVVVEKKLSVEETMKNE